MRVLFLAALAIAAPVYAKRVDRDTLMQVVTPRHRAEAPAHPFVNVIVRFGTTSTKVPADPSTFNARIGNHDVTSQFEDEVVDGVVIGKRGQLDDQIGRAHV